MAADLAHPGHGMPYVRRGSPGLWGRALILIAVGAILSGVLYAFCLMSGPVRWAWTTPDRSPGPFAGLAAAFCSIPATLLGAAAIAIGRVAARWLARLLTIVLGILLASACVVTLLGQAPLGTPELLAARPVTSREISLGAGALEVLRDPASLGARFEGLRAVAADDRVLFAGVLLGAVVCGACALDLSYRLARWWTNGFLLDARTGEWFGDPVDACAFRTRSGARPAFADLGALERIGDEVVDLRLEPILVLRVHPSSSGLDDVCCLVSVVEVAFRPKGLLRKGQAVRREVVPPTFMARAELDVLVRGGD